jgi:hypothetical protein
MGDIAEIISQIQVLQEQGAGLSAANQANNASLMAAIEAQKSGAYEAAYGDLQNNTNTLHSLYYYGLRDADLSGAQLAAINTLSASANQLVSDEQFAKRQNEINQWTAGNKADTLFIYQQLLIILCATIILVYLLKRGILSTTVFGLILGTLALIFIFTVVNRVQYTTKLRDKQFWNKRTFEKEAGSFNVCGTGGLLEQATDFQSDISAGLNSVTSGINSAMTGTNSSEPA